MKAIHADFDRARRRHNGKNSDQILESVLFAAYLRGGSLFVDKARVLIASLDGTKFSPHQPRVPAGNPDGGQWTSGRDDYGDILLASDISSFTKHGINQAINRGIRPEAILDAVNNPFKIVQRGDGTVRYIGKDAVVVLNADGALVTVWGQ